MVGDLGETGTGTDHRLAFVRQSQRILIAAEQARELKPEDRLEEEKGEIASASITALQNPSHRKCFHL